MNIIGSSEANRFNPRPLTNVHGARGFGIRYPSPFFDVAQQFLPETVHQLFLWCRFYFLTNPIINAACSKMAEYPVTPLVFEDDDKSITALWEDMEKRLKLQQFQVEVGLDYFVYGNAFVSVFFPFVKFLECTHCHNTFRADKNRSAYRWKNQQFQLVCPKCKEEGYAVEHDVYLRNARGIKLIRWNPENIEIKHNEINGSATYYYKVPKHIINDVKLGQRDTIEGLPVEILTAIRSNRAILFDPANLYHLKRPTIAQKDQGWGSPLIYPLLKDAFYLQVMKKANESILLNYVTPLNVIFPGQNTGGNESYGSYNLLNWKSKIDAELNLWRRDPGYIPILPVNIGYQQLGGTAKNLIVHQEMRVVAEYMLSGAGVPPEMVFGGLQWTGTNTSLRALQNTFEGYNNQREELTVDFVLGHIARYMGWPKPKARFGKFKMADDLQRTMFYLQLNQAQKISNRRLLEEVGEDYDRELDRMDGELKRELQTQRRSQIANADIQGAAQLRGSRYQAKSQALMGAAQMELQQQQAAAGAPQPGQGDPSQAQGDPQQGGQPPQGEGAAYAPQDPADGAQPNASNVPVALAGMSSPIQAGAGGMDLRYLAQRASSYLHTLRDQSGAESMYKELERMKTQNPNLYKMVIQLTNDSGSKSNPLNAADPSAPKGQQVDASRQV
jgi:hypothetical protein